MNLGVASRDPALVAEIRALLLKHKVLFFRDQDITRAEHVAFARHFGDWRTTRWPAATRKPRAGAHLQVARAPNDRYENAWHTDATWREKPPWLRAALRGVPAGGRRHHVGQHGAGLRALPAAVKDQIAGLRARHSIEASFGAAMPIEKRLALHAQFPDAEHPVVRTHPETGEKILFVNAFTTHFTNFHTGQRALRPGLHARRLRPAALPDRPGADPEYQVRFRWKPNSHGHVGQPVHAALRRHRLPALPSQDGTRRDHGRHALLKPQPTTTQKDPT